MSGLLAEVVGCVPRLAWKPLTGTYLARSQVCVSGVCTLVGSERASERARRACCSVGTGSFEEARASVCWIETRGPQRFAVDRRRWHPAGWSPACSGPISYSLDLLPHDATRPPPAPAPRRQRLVGVEGRALLQIQVCEGRLPSRGERRHWTERGRLKEMRGLSRGDGVRWSVKRQACQEWDSNPRLQGRLRPERSALDRSAILTAGLGRRPLASQATGDRRPGARKRASADRAPGQAPVWPRLAASGCSSCGPRPPNFTLPEEPRRRDAARRQSTSRSRSGSPPCRPLSVPTARRAARVCGTSLSS